MAEAWGRMSAIRSVPVIDALLAATARVHDLVLATRNDHKVREVGRLLDGVAIEPLPPEVTPWAWLPEIQLPPESPGSAHALLRDRPETAPCE